MNMALSTSSISVATGIEIEPGHCAACKPDRRPGSHVGQGMRHFRHDRAGRLKRRGDGSISQAAASQPRPEQVTGPSHAAADRTDRPPQAASGLVMGQAFEVAKHDRSAEALGQPIHLLVQRRGLLAVHRLELGETFDDRDR